MASSVDFGRGLWRREHRTECAALVLVLAVAVLLRTWNLAQNGFGREYYAAGVLSMLGSWHNFLYCAFDPGGFVSLDKPPLAIWLQVAGAKLLGFSGMAVLLPQVLAGLVAIVLLHALVRRSFGRAAALGAALIFALTPVSVAVDRSNNTESLLVALLLAATLVGARAAETGSLARLAGAMALLGLGFNVKMGAALVLAPFIMGAFSFANRSAPVRWHATRQAVAGAVLVGVSLAWAVMFDLTPASQRPYAGSTRHNSMLELALVHNGAARFMAARAGQKSGVPVASTAADEARAAPLPPPELTDTSPTGPLRLLRPRQAAQAGWLLPLVAAGIFVVVRSWRRREASLRQRLATGLLLGWLAAYWVVLSAAGGYVHTYYIAVLAPPLAAFAGIGLAGLWRRLRAESPGLVMLGLATASVAGWQSYLFLGQTGLDLRGWLPALWLTAMAMIATAAITGLFARSCPASATLAKRAAGAGFMAGALVLPVMAAASVVLVRPNVAAPYADIGRLAAIGIERGDGMRAQLRERVRARLLDYLRTANDPAKYLIAVPNAVIAAPLIIATGKPVMAMGGYLGDDPILTPDSLRRSVSAGEVRFVMLGGFTLAPERLGALSAIEGYVRANGRAVDPAQWRLGRATSGTYRVRVGDGVIEVRVPELFDMRPGKR